MDIQFDPLRLRTISFNTVGLDNILKGNIYIVIKASIQNERENKHAF